MPNWRLRISLVWIQTCLRLTFGCYAIYTHLLYAFAHKQWQGIFLA